MSPQHRQTSVPTMSSMTAARRIIREMVDGGVRHVVVAPGSRSAPLAYAIAEFEAQHPELLTSHVRIDERSAAFFALGIGLNTGRPAAVITTSGTAVGNLLPAAMEANHAAVPLLLLTADRPEELLGTGANQTTVQENIFGEHVRFATSVPAGEDPTPEVRQALTASLGVLTQEHTTNASESNPVFAPEGVTSQSTAPGPVHVNVCFRDPLTPLGDSDEDQQLALILATDLGEAEPENEAGLTGATDDRADSPSEASLQKDETEERRTVVIAGHDAGAIATHFAEAAGLPLLAEPSSNARFGDNAITAYRLLIPVLLEKIERVVVFGRPTLNREIASLLASEHIPSALYVPEPVAWFAPGKRAERIVEDIDDLKLFAGHGLADWLETWRKASDRALAVLEPLWAHEDGRISVHEVARTVWNDVEGNLVIGSSNIIRDMDMAATTSTLRHRAFANRGLAGIDGTISTALGIAASSSAVNSTGDSASRTTLVLGDVTFLHDVSALAHGTHEPEFNLDIVVLNDNGGGIFSTLEHGRVAQQERWSAAVERFFGTPQSVQIADIARGFGAKYDAAVSVAELASLLQRAPEGIRVIEVSVSRADRREQTSAMREVVEAEFSGMTTPPAQS